MSHLTQEQAERLKELGYPIEVSEDIKYWENVDWIGRDPMQLPSAEELMEWLKKTEEGQRAFGVRWHPGARIWEAWTADGMRGSESLIDALYLLALWVLEGKK
jgi:hypothetical protein